ncbi:hypothetical protein D030_3263A, partial [Vibrio parahaemolyticus AQ3810]
MDIAFQAATSFCPPLKIRPVKNVTKTNNSNNTTGRSKP